MQSISNTSPAGRLCLAALLIILIAGFSLRFSYNSETLMDNPVRGDAKYYIYYAFNLIEHQVFSKEYNVASPVPDSFWAPGYPVFLAAVMVAADTLGLRFFDLLLFTQLLLGVSTIALTYSLARMCTDKSWALVPAGLVALSPHLVSMGAYALTETLLGFLLVLGLTLISQGVKSGRSSFFGVGGGTLACAYLVNPVTAFIAPIACAIYFLGRKNNNPEDSIASSWKVLCLMLTPLVMVVSLWEIRNSSNVPAGAPDSSVRLMTNLTIGMHPDYHQRWLENPRDPNNPAVLDGQRIQNSYKKFAKVFMEYAKEDPLGFLSWYTLEKPVVLWSWNILIGQGDIYVYPVFYSLYHVSKTALATYAFSKSIHPWLLMCALLAGLYACRDMRPQEKQVFLMVYCSTLYMSAVYIVTQSEPRYSIPLRPEMYLCATYFIYGAARTYRRWKRANAK